MARRKKGQAISGWINLDKPYDLTSTFAVSRIRRLFDAQKAGHAGTLDPLATGILPIALGEATKTVPFLVDADKSYRFTIAWGRTTATYDREGETIASSDVRPTPDAGGRRAAALHRRDRPGPARLFGHQGRRRARLRPGPRRRDGGARVSQGASSSTPASPRPRTPTTSRSRWIAARAPTSARWSATSPKRSARAATSARCGAPAWAASRKQNAVTLELLEDLGYEARQSEALLPVETALDDIPVLAVTDEDAFRLKQGRSIVLVPRQVEAVKARLKPGSRTVSAMAGGSMVALCEMRAGRLEPSRVFNL